MSRTSRKEMLHALGELDIVKHNVESILCCIGYCEGWEKGAPIILDDVAAILDDLNNTIVARWKENQKKKREKLFSKVKNNEVDAAVS